MNSDSYYSIGSSHLVCQDYALNFEHKGDHYIIISDGCSSSDHVDIGSRILCWEAKLEVEKSYFDHRIGENIIKNAQKIIKTYGLSSSCLDATLLICKVGNEFINILGWGDGGFRVEYKDGTNTSRLYSYKSNAPNYLSQRFLYNNEVLENDFCEDIYCDKELVDSRCYNNDIFLFESFYVRHPYNGKEIKNISIFSDGMFSYRRDNKEISYIDLFNIFDYRGTGEFIKKRMNFFNKDCRREGISHHDDFSLASIIL